MELDLEFEIRKVIGIANYSKKRQFRNTDLESGALPFRHEIPLIRIWLDVTEFSKYLNLPMFIVQQTLKTNLNNLNFSMKVAV